ncbi:MAG: DUF3667 domain-containing protein [Gemmatimonadetes bacterium]|nr:DUF3667 domain-containing protein [Gemmatimonadota bacterium]
MDSANGAAHHIRAPGTAANGVAHRRPTPYLDRMIDNRGATRVRSPHEPCLNCGDSTTGRYCPSCGQRKTDVRVSLRTLFADVLEDQLVLNRALPRTLTSLLFHPGFLTEEYVRGRIVRYIAPFRLYLVSSVVFFLLLSFVGMQTLQVAMNDTGDTRGGDGAAVVAPVQLSSGQDTLPAAVRRGLDADSTLPPGTLQPWASELGFDGTSPLFRRALERKLAQVGHLPIRDAIQSVLRDLLEYAPHMVFLLLPLFAGMLKLLYVRRSRFYAEHFVFALHVHAFVFVMFTIMFILPWEWVDGFFVLWIAVYVWLALRRVYGQGWVRTTLKWWTLGWMYFWFLLFGVIGLALATLLLT